MHFLAILAVGASVLAGFASSSPLETRQAPAQFWLKTSVAPGINDCGSSKDGLFLSSYHTGAGLGKAVGVRAQPDPGSPYFYLNDTDLLWVTPGNDVGPWPVTIDYGAYQAFYPIDISVAGIGPTPGFFINSTGLQSNQTTGGWLACDWWYQAPQLFILNGVDNGPLPSSCSIVNLVPVAAS